MAGTVAVQVIVYFKLYPNDSNRLKLLVGATTQCHYTLPCWYLCAGSLGLVGTSWLPVPVWLPLQVSGHMPHRLHLDFVVELSHWPLWRHGEDSLHSYVSFSPCLCYCYSILNLGLSRFVNSLLRYCPRTWPFALIAHYCLHGMCEFLEFRMTLIEI